MKCPRDKAVLTFTDDGGSMRNRCPECSGLLLGGEDVAAALGGRGAARVEALEQGTLACPRDGAPMRVLRHKGVELDLCARCGSLWLDAGELEKIREQPARPGRAAKIAALAGGAAALAGGAAIAANAANAPAAQSAASSGLLDGAGGTVVEGAVSVALDFAGEALGALLEGIF